MGKCYKNLTNKKEKIINTTHQLLYIHHCIYFEAITQVVLIFINLSSGTYAKK